MALLLHAGVHLVFWQEALPHMHHITEQDLTPHQALTLVQERQPLVLSEQSSASIERAYQYLHQRIASRNETIYGVNTGFGAFCNTRISPDQLTQLQYNLLRSHSCGVGEPVSAEVVRMLLLLKIHSLSLGHSGVQLQTVQRLIDFYNQDVLPVVYEKGSLGASGDLVPLAHLCLPLIGEGEVWHEGERMPAAEAMKIFGWAPIALQAKEGLALINGTQYSLSLALLSWGRAVQLLHMAHATAALSAEAYEAKHEPFHALIQEVRRQPGQQASAKLMRTLLQGSAKAKGHAGAVQDPYSFRCIPQVHGASWAALEHIGQVLGHEINAVTDNPLLFPEQDEVLMGGNFHAQPIALPTDYLAIAMSELASISERRTYLLLGGKRDLPEFLTGNPGLESGLMIPQYAAASLVSLNKQLCSPASVDSIVSSNGQEDHVSMAANAGLKAMQVAQNALQVLAIELITARQALLLRGNPELPEHLAALVAEYDMLVEPSAHDRNMSTEIELATAFLGSYSFSEDLCEVLLA